MSEAPAAKDLTLPSRGIVDLARSTSDSASVRMMASKAIGEIDLAFALRLTLSAVAASTTNLQWA